MTFRHAPAFRHIARLAAMAALVIIAVPAFAQNGDPVEVGANIEFVGVQSDIMIEDGDDAA